MKTFLNISEDFWAGDVELEKIAQKYNYKITIYHPFTMTTEGKNSKAFVPLAKQRFK